jgi:hypothetical protein
MSKGDEGEDESTVLIAQRDLSPPQMLTQEQSESETQSQAQSQSQSQSQSQAQTQSQSQAQAQAQLDISIESADGEEGEYRSHDHSPALNCEPSEHIGFTLQIEFLHRLTTIVDALRQVDRPLRAEVLAQELQVRLAG